MEYLYKKLKQRFRDIKDRCYNKNGPQYKDYGGRGIKCEWEDVSEFIFDMLESYKKHYNDNNGDTTIERKNVNGNYSKENCIWITLAEQQRNRRDNKRHTIDGVTLIQAVLARRYKKDARQLSKRLMAGRTIKQALGIDEPKEREVEMYNGKTLTLLIKESGVKDGTVRSRLKRGWSIERALGKDLAVIKREFNGKPISYYANELGMNVSSIYERIEKGWTIEEAVTIKKKGKRIKKD